VVEAALADTRLGDDPDRGGLSLLRPLQRPVEARQLGFSADEAREAALAGEVEAGAGGTDPGRLAPLISNSPRSWRSR